MTAYRRLILPEGTYFFTVCLEDRGRMTLVDHIDQLRAANPQHLDDAALAERLDLFALDSAE